MFAYCLNNPVQYSDRSGNLARAANPNASCFDTHSPSGGGGGAVISFYFIDAVLDATSTAKEWIDEQKEAISGKLTLSLSKATSRKYKTEYEEHHLVARKSRNATKAAAILNNTLPGGVESPMNKVWVKTSVHRRIHTKLYYAFANQLVIGAYYEAGSDKQKQYENVVTALGILQVFVSSLNILSNN